MNRNRIVGVMAVLAGGLVAGCLPPAGTYTPAPTLVGERELGPVELMPAAVMVDGKPAVKVGPVRVVIVAKRYANGSVYYEIKSVTPASGAAFAILLPEHEVASPVEEPPGNTRLYVARKRVVTRNDLIQLHVVLELERSDASGNEHPPKIVASCTTELWGNRTTYLGERRLLDNGGVAKWSAIEERIESHERNDVESGVSEAVDVPAPAEYVPQDKGTIKPEMPRPLRRIVGYGTFAMPLPVAGPTVE
jgi:hypothetical protein